MTEVHPYDRAVAALRAAQAGVAQATVHLTAVERERRALIAAGQWPDPNAGASTGCIASVDPGGDIAEALEALSAQTDSGVSVLHLGTGPYQAVRLDRPWAPPMFRRRIVRLVGRAGTEILADASGTSLYLGRGMGDIEGAQIELWAMTLRGDVRRERGIGAISIRWMDCVTKSREVDAHGD